MFQNFMSELLAVGRCPCHRVSLSLFFGHPKFVPSFQRWHGRAWKGAEGHTRRVWSYLLFGTTGSPVGAPNKSTRSAWNSCGSVALRTSHPVALLLGKRGSESGAGHGEIHLARPSNRLAGRPRKGRSTWGQSNQWVFIGLVSF